MDFALKYAATGSRLWNINSALEEGIQENCKGIETSKKIPNNLQTMLTGWQIDRNAYLLLIHLVTGLTCFELHFQYHNTKHLEKSSPIAQGTWILTSVIEQQKKTLYWIAYLLAFNIINRDSSCQISTQK